MVDHVALGLDSAVLFVGLIIYGVRLGRAVWRSLPERPSRPTGKLALVGRGRAGSGRELGGYRDRGGAWGRLSSSADQQGELHRALSVQ
jgi:hypothetical protein